MKLLIFRPSLESIMHLDFSSHISESLELVRSGLVVDELHFCSIEKTEMFSVEIISPTHSKCLHGENNELFLLLKLQLNVKKD